jgi:hypothetical protein
VSNQSQPTREQVIDMIKNVIVSVDVHDNAVILSAYRLISYFIKDTQDVEKILKVDVNEDNELVVYASARPKSQYIKSLIIKATLTNDILSMLKMKYELIKDKDDVYIKLYLGSNQLQNVSITNNTKELNF